MKMIRNLNYKAVKRLENIVKCCSIHDGGYSDLVDFKKIIPYFCEKVFEKVFESSRRKIDKASGGRFDEFKNNFIGLLNLNCLTNPSAFMKVFDEALRFAKDNREPAVTMDTEEAFMEVFPNVREVLKDMGYTEEQLEYEESDDYNDNILVVLLLCDPIKNWVKIMADILNTLNPTPREFFIEKYKWQGINYKKSEEIKNKLKADPKVVITEHEGVEPAAYMATSNLKNIIEDASELLSLLNKEDVLPQWADESISLAKANVDEILDYVRSQKTKDGKFWLDYTSDPVDANHVENLISKHSK